MLDRLFLLSCFFPFVSPYPIGTDVQPLVGVFAILVVIKYGLILRVVIPKSYVVVIVFALFFLVYTNPFANGFSPQVGKMVSLTFGSFILIAFYFSRDCLDKKFINFVVVFYFLFTLLLLTITESMIELQNIVVRNTNTTEFSYRGVGTLSTEPGLFGGLLIFFLLVIDYLRERSVLSRRNQYGLYVMILIMILATKSGMGYLYFVFYLVFRFYTSKISVVAKVPIFLAAGFLGAFILVFLIQFKPEGLGRGVEVLIQLTTNPYQLISEDASILTRVIDVAMGLTSMVFYPFGVGNGNVMEASYNLMLDTPFIKDFYDKTNKPFGFTSSFSYLTVSYGIFFWCFLIYLYFYHSKSSVSCRFFSVLFLTVSYSAAFPAIWILLGLNFYPDKNKLN